MDKETFTQYLENRYQKQMEYYSKTSAKNQDKYKNFQWVLIVLSALTPVLAALDGKWFSLQIAVVITSAIVAILTTGLKTFQYQELWVNYRATYEQLKPEIHYYNFNIGPYGGEGIDKESLFVTRIEKILDQEHQGWPPSKKLQEESKKAGKAEAPGVESGNPEGEG